ncbi:hypothetical protein R84B8_01835 [Treponema sp. R8-4-B8]
MSDNNDNKKTSKNNGWALHLNYDGEYEEKTFLLSNMAVIFTVTPYKRSETLLSFTLSSPSENARNGALQSYKVKGSADYAKKIAENAAKEFENIPCDSGDIDLCLRKAFSLRKINARKGKGE